MLDSIVKFALFDLNCLIWVRAFHFHFLYILSSLLFHFYSSLDLQAYFLHELERQGGQGQFEESRVSAWSSADWDVYTFSAGTADRLEREVHRSEM